MATLISQDTSGVLLAQEGEQEIQRTRSAKKFLVQRFEDGRTQYRIGASIGPIHYNEDVLDASGDWHEIDLDLLPVTGQGWRWECTTNGYEVRVWNRYGLWAPYTACFLRAGQWVRMSPLALCYENSAGERQVISRPVTGITGVVDNEAHTITWVGCFGAGIDFKYNLAPDKFFKTVTVNSLDALPLPTIAEGGLRLTVLMALSWSGQAGNGFGAEQDLTVLPSAEPEDAADEELPDFSAFSVLRPEDARESLWLQTPRSWDAEGADIPMQYQLRRYGSKVIGAFSVAAADLEGRTFPVCVDTAITEEQVGASTDDGTTRDSTWPVDSSPVGVTLTGNTMAIGYSSYSYHMGHWRFQTVPIPKGATIDSASIKLLNAVAINDSASWTVGAEDIDNAATFDASTHNGYHCYTNSTTATATWSIGNWANSTWYESSSLSGCVEEVVARASWASDNALVLFAYPASSSETKYRSVRQWDTPGNVSGAKFNCTYTVAGTTYYVTLSETATATETVPCTPKRSLSETATASEIIARQADRTLAEIATGQDALARTVERLLSETATGTDTLALSRLLAILLSETVTGADALAKLIGRSLSETATGTDNMTLSAILTLAEETTGTDSITRALSRGLSETSTGTDVLQRVAARLLEDALTGTDTTTQTVSRTLAETATAQDAILREVARQLAEVATGDDALTREASRTLSETATAEDATAREVARLLGDTATTGDDLSRVVGRTLAETMTADDALTAELVAELIKVLLTETATATDTVTRATARQLSEVATVADALYKLTGRTLTDTATAQDATSLSVARTLTEQAEAADTITRVVARALTEQVGLNDDIARLLARALTDTLDATDLLSSHLAQVYQVTLTELVTATDTLSRQQLLILAVTLAAQIINARLEAETLNATLVARTLNARLDAEAIDATQTTRTLNTRGEGE